MSARQQQSPVVPRRTVQIHLHVLKRWVAFCEARGFSAMVPDHALVTAYVESLGGSAGRAAGTGRSK